MHLLRLRLGPPLGSHNIPLGTRVLPSGNLNRRPSAGPTELGGISSSDSFEQLAAQAAAQLGVSTAADPGHVENLCTESPWNGTRPDAG